MAAEGHDDADDDVAGWTTPELDELLDNSHKKIEIA
jgi:hypothetical protein